ncbi:alpha/beta fold hydrolase [Ornithinimicrobium sediminis]|uniref:alpha/beta fold hydrolase n=1 Tax=Ornithinimicrobium sediminis TaxID=2904603 RepID=UPI001E468630|nr:alpha/beta hydrolase [Ornithinimicrobium sediminis]MCE0486937.1 alpha/beta fold hydrolase [Ornithinimicrobium sediminis]
MGEVPEVRFAQASGSSVAYTVYGDGPVTICGVPPMAQNVELAWESPVMRRMFERYAAFSRQVVFDKRGTGLSDRSLDIPGLDERVDELLAVMDAAGVQRAFVHGVSEGGPMAIMFAATYPERVEGLVLEGTAASLLSSEQRRARSTREGMAAARERWRAFVETWGTPQSRSVAHFGPSLLTDPEFCAWWPHYERHSASRDALIDLFRTNGDMDAREVVGRVEAPVLIVHRTDDPVIPLARARETYALFRRARADVRIEELPGQDHWTFAGDLDALCDAVERFTTGRVQARVSPPSTRGERPRHAVRVVAMGRFEVVVDGQAVPLGSWGSRRARTLLKRLIVARGWPVPREELLHTLWPDEQSGRLGARLSVQLSAARRVLHGAVVADRSTVRLDLESLEIDVEEWFGLSDDRQVVESYAELLPEDRYEDWTRPLREEMRDRFVTVARRVAEQTTAAAEAAVLLRRVLELDPYDEHAHRLLVLRLRADGRHGEAAVAQERYDAAMAELEA